MFLKTGGAITCCWYHNLFVLLLISPCITTRRWMCGGNDQIANSTRHGLALHPNFTTTGTTENAAFLAAIVGSNNAVKRTKQETFQCWALSQVRYVLGDGGRSLLGGFGEEPPQVCVCVACAW